MFWVGATAAVLLASSGGDLWRNIKDAFASGVSETASAAAPLAPASSAVAVGNTPQATGLGGQPIQPGGPFSSNDQPGVGANLGYPTDTPGGSGVSVGPSSDRVGIGGAGGPLPGMGSYRYGRIGNSYGELVG